MYRRTLSCDIETFSSVNLLKCGVYAYAESPDFEILLFSYAFDDEPIECIDLTQDEGKDLPFDIMSALCDPEILKTAFNANFERTCLSAFYDMEMPPEQWECTAVLARQLSCRRRRSNRTS